MVLKKLAGTKARKGVAANDKGRGQTQRRPPTAQSDSETHGKELIVKGQATPSEQQNRHLMPCQGNRSDGPAKGETAS